MEQNYTNHEALCLKNARDRLGRVIAVTTPLGTTSNFYDTATGRLTRVSRTGMADTLYFYNSLGELEKTVLDVDDDGEMDETGTDRITVNDSFYQEISNDWWRVSISAVYNETNSANVITTSISRVRITGLGTDAFNGAKLSAQSQSEDWLGNVTTSSTYTDAGNLTVWQVTDTPVSNQDDIRKSIADYPVLTISSACITNTFTYDGFARQVTATDGRGNTSTTAYNELGQVAYVEDAASNRTSFVYNGFGQRVATSNALGQVAYTAYDPLGHAIATWGTSYPVAYQFDTAGNMVAMVTTRSNEYASVNLNTLVPIGETLSSLITQNSALDITRWCYDDTTGLLTSKLYADGNGTAYTYTDSGRLATRTWARGPVTTYSYDSLGQLTEIDYSQWSTPDVTYTHDRLGRTLAAISTASTNTFEYSGMALTKETQDNYIIERKYDALGRAIGYELYTPDDLINPVQTIIYDYSSNGRFHSVSSVHSVVTNTFTYAFLPGTDLISGYTSSAGFASLREYETDRNLITAITNAWNSSVISSFNYHNDPLGRRTKRTDWHNASTITNFFTYNNFSEVAGAVMGDDSYMLNFDPIGNRQLSVLNAATNIYSANQLNQYTAISGGMSASPTHDDDGNLTYDGSAWHHSWDAENRLIKSEPNTVTNGAYMLEYKLNNKNLRVEKTVRQLSGRDPSYPMDPQADPGTWDAIESRKYIWDGFNIAAEIIIDHLTPATNISYYTWGMDLSGTLQGAGGVGGLLAVTEMDSGTNTYYACADGNGNITEYVNDSGSTVAHYEYSAFGEIADQSGSKDDDFTHRFSTKPLDVETKIIKYQLRDYIPSLCCWASRDRIGIRGGLKENGVLENDVINKFDVLGLASSPWGNEYSFGCCGPDVTKAVKQTLNNIVRLFAYMEPSAKRSACESLYNESASGAWDIEVLAAWGKGDRTGTGRCKRTVVYEDKCVYAGSLNYISFGIMNKLCHEKYKFKPVDVSLPSYASILPYSMKIDWSLKDALFAVAYRKHLELFDFKHTVVQAYEFTAEGFQGNTPFFNSISKEKNCPLKKCSIFGSTPIKQGVLNGHWNNNRF